MNGTSSAREALIAETLGEMAGLLDRVEAVAPALDSSRPVHPARADPASGSQT